MKSSQEQPPARWDRVISDLNDVFDGDPLLDEIGFIPSEASTTSEEQYLIHVHHKLGIVSFILKDLFQYAVTEFNRLISTFDPHVTSGEEGVCIARITRMILAIKGDYPMAYIYRKKLIQHDLLSTSHELNFLNVIFTKHPKSPSAWQHRRWCLLRLLKKSCSNDDLSLSLDLREYMESHPSLIVSELSICEKSSEAYPKNYYAWMHRLWLLSFMSHENLCGELSFTCEWLKRHVSDHSAVNHRYQVVERIMNDLMSPSETVSASMKQHLSEAIILDDNQDILIDDNLSPFGRILQQLRIEDNNSCSNQSPLLSMFVRFCNSIWLYSSRLLLDMPGHEALWHHRRSLIKLTILHISKAFLEAQGHITDLEPYLALISKLFVQVANLVDDTRTIATRTNPEDAQLFEGSKDFYHSSDSFHSPVVDVEELPMLNCDPNISLILSSDLMLVNLIVHEFKFIVTILNLRDSWNYASQREQCLRYLTYMLFEMTQYSHNKADDLLHHSLGGFYEQMTSLLSQEGWQIHSRHDAHAHSST